MKKAKLQHGWKVVDWRRQSAEIIHNPIRYSTVRWSRPRPKCGPLCVFNSKRSARRFRSPLYHSIYECLYDPSLLKEIWNYAEREEKISLNRLPRGTKLASRVKLTKLVFPHKLLEFRGKY